MISELTLGAIHPMNSTGMLPLSRSPQQGATRSPDSCRGFAVGANPHQDVSEPLFSLYA